MIINYHTTSHEEVWVLRYQELEGAANPVSGDVAGAQLASTGLGNPLEEEARELCRKEHLWPEFKLTPTLLDFVTSYTAGDF